MKKGFALIELIAVLVVLALIYYIATTNFTGNNTIEEDPIDYASKETFEISARGIIKAAENDYMRSFSQNVSPDVTYVFENGLQVSERKLNFGGSIPQNGYVTVNIEGQIKLAIEDGVWCIKKDFFDQDINTSELTDNCLN